MFLIYKQDRVNFFRGVTAPFIFISPFVFGLPHGYEILAVLVLWALLNDINHVLHLHIHHPFTNNKFLNLYLDISMSLVTGMTASNWRIQHKYRHHYRNVKDYGEGLKWEMEKFSILGSVVFSFRTIFPILFMPIIEAFQKGVMQNEKEPINYRIAFFAQIMFFVVFSGLVVWNWKLALYYALSWYFLVHFVTRYIDYLNHCGTEDSTYSHSNNSLNRLYNKLGCNFGYHTAHHLNPSAHWTKLPEIYHRFEKDIDDKYKKYYTWSGFAMPWHFLLSLKSRM